MTARMDIDVAIIGAGTAGTFAMREARRAKLNWRMIDHGPLGTTCARVGCMPSKVALHAAAAWDGRQFMADELGITGTEQLKIDLGQVWAHVREYRDYFAGKTAKGIEKGAAENLIMGRARFLSPSSLEVDTAEGKLEVHAKAIVIATGSRPVLPGFLKDIEDRVWTTDTLFEQTQIPARVGILGLGVIGLEMGLALSRLGVQVVGADMAERIGGIADPEVAQAALESLGSEFPLWLGQPASVSRTAKGVLLRSGEREAEVDVVLAALGRSPNFGDLGLADIGVALNERGLPTYNPDTMQIEGQPIFLAGDISTLRPLQHEAGLQGAAAGFNAARIARQEAAQAFEAKTPLGIAFTSPDIATVGKRWDELDPSQIIVGEARSASNARSHILGPRGGLLRIYADAQSGVLLGAALITPAGEHLAHHLSVLIQRGETAVSALQLPYYHPVVEETISAALGDIVRRLPNPSPWPLGLAPKL